MLTFLYPRMDYNVSTSQNHLLKLPFSIHPTSQKVSVPIFPESVRSFDPDDVAIKFENLIK
jgi:DNA primase small subunit